MKVTQSIRFNSLVLGLFALVTAVLLAGTYLGTRDVIAESERQAAQKTLLEIYPPTTHDNNLLDDTLAVPRSYLPTLGLDGPSKIYVARKNGSIIGFIIPAIAPDGYSGNIHMLTGINRDGTIAGVRITSHAETPGLGDKVELRKSDWVLSFIGKSLGNPPVEQWAVKKDKGAFDQFTGATITPRAVVAKVRDTLRFYKEHKQELIKRAGEPPAKAG
ncbi:MAG: electron transport complex subunit RsxG [Porticoccaceae bacterium]|nr:electron transport complex subunit RsxG [Porticoccaceae bacterium]